MNKYAKKISYKTRKWTSGCSLLPWDRSLSLPCFFYRCFLSVLIIVFVCSCASEKVKQEPLKPDEALAKGDKLISDDEYEEARQVLGEIKGNDTTRKYAPIAQLKIAESYMKEENREMAVTEYRRFIEQYPDSQYAPYAQYQIAMIYFDQIKGPERGAGQAKSALEEFRKLKKMYPRNPYKEATDIKINKCLDVMANYEFLVGEFYFKKDAYKAALGRFLGILEQYPDYRAIDQVLYYIVLSYKSSANMDKAFKYFHMLKEKHPDSEYIKKLTEELSGDG